MECELRARLSTCLGLRSACADIAYLHSAARSSTWSASWPSHGPQLGQRSVAGATALLSLSSPPLTPPVSHERRQKDSPNRQPPLAAAPHAHKGKARPLPWSPPVPVPPWNNPGKQISKRPLVSPPPNQVRTTCSTLLALPSTSGNKKHGFFFFLPGQRAGGSGNGEEGHRISRRERCGI